LVALQRAKPKVNISDGFLKLRGNYETLFIRNHFNPKLFAENYNNLEKKLISRKNKAKIYFENLQHLEPISFLNGWENSGCCWRFSFLINKPQNLVDFSESIRKDGFHVSNLYWPVNQFFCPKDDCPKADFFGRRILNLWVDENVTNDWVKSCCISIKKHANILN